MNRTIVIFTGLTLVVYCAINQTEAVAQSRSSSRRDLIDQEGIGASAELGNASLLEGTEKSMSAWPLEVGGGNYWEGSEIESPSPQTVLSLSASGRIPEQTGDDGAFSEVDQVAVRAVKVVEVKGDHFFHKTLPFEEPLHERFGISHSPAKQLTKSTLVFFGKSLLLPANFLPRRNNQRDFDSNEGWREAQGRQALQRCE